MQHQTINSFLEKLGLEPKEIRVYLYCLEYGPQLMARLAQVVDTTRTNAYDIVKKLEARGLCHTVGSSYGRKVQASDPKDIRDLLDNKAKAVKDLAQEFETVLPLLKKGGNTLASPITRVSYFEGVDNVRKMLWQSLQAKNPLVKVAGSELDMIESLGKEYVAQYHIARKKKQITLRALRPDAKRAIGEVFKNDTLYLREIRIRPDGEIRLKSNIILWDNYIALYSLKNKAVFGTLIESEDMSLMLGTWLDFIWEKSKKVK